MKKRHHKYKNTNKFIKDYDAPQAHIVEKGVLYQVNFLLHVIQLYSQKNILFVPKQRQIDS